MTSRRYLIVTYRRSAAPDYWGQVRYEDGSEFEQLHADCCDDAIAQLTSVLVSASQEKLDKKCERETFLYVNGFGPDPIGVENQDDQEEFLALHDIAVIWSAATERAKIEIQARAEKAAAAREAHEKAAAEHMRTLATQEIERLKKLHRLT